MDIMTVKESHHIELFSFEHLKGINGAGAAAGVEEQFQFRSPKIAVPTLTMVDPSSMATLKSLLMPMDRWAIFFKPDSSISP
jgi:hypothetical protein